VAAAVERWRAVPLSAMPVSGVEPPPGGIFSRLTSLATYTISGNNVIAMCKGVLRMKDGVPCFKDTKIVRDGELATSNLVSHFRAAHPYALYTSERKANPEEEAAAAAEEARTGTPRTACLASRSSWRTRRARAGRRRAADRRR